jgi:hypothetical protein
MTQIVKRNRPGGVTALAVLQILGGIGALLLGAGSVMLMGMVGQITPTELSAQTGILGALTGVMGIIFIIFALVSFVVAWGYLAGKPWARLLGILFAALEAIYGLISLPGGIVTIALAALIIYYLTRPAVISWFSPSSPVSKV